MGGVGSVAVGKELAPCGNPEGATAGVVKRRQFAVQDVVGSRNVRKRVPVVPAQPTTRGRPEVALRPLGHVPDQVVREAVGGGKVLEGRGRVSQNPLAIGGKPEVAARVSEEASDDNVAQAVGEALWRTPGRLAVEPVLGGHPERAVGQV